MGICGGDEGKGGFKGGNFVEVVRVRGVRILWR